jgi:hypothetical protein
MRSESPTRGHGAPARSIVPGVPQPSHCRKTTHARSTEQQSCEDFREQLDTTGEADHAVLEPTPAMWSARRARGVVTSGGNDVAHGSPVRKVIGPADIESAGPISPPLTNRGADHVDDYWRAGRRRFRVPVHPGAEVVWPWRATAAARLSLFAEISVVVE